MKTLRVGDLKAHLAKHNLSPEKLALEANLSHMTIRRWLKREDSDVIPEKYYPLLSPIVAQKAEYSPPFSPAFSVETLMSEIEKSGENFEDVEKLDTDVHKKLKSTRIDRVFFDYSKQLLQAIRSPKVSLRSKSIAIGALIYFVSPIDLIPDHIPVIGYLDDLAVMSLAVNSLKQDHERADALSPKRK